MKRAKEESDNGRGRVREAEISRKAHESWGSVEGCVEAAETGLKQRDRIRELAFMSLRKEVFSVVYCRIVLP